MTVQELESQLLALTPIETVDAIRILTQSINQSARGITKTPGVMGGDACIAGTRIPVWLLVNFRRFGISDGQLLYDYPTLNATDLVNVWAYANAYPEEIETAIREQEEA